MGRIRTTPAGTRLRRTTAGNLRTGDRLWLGHDGPDRDVLATVRQIDRPGGPAPYQITVLVICDIIDPLPGWEHTVDRDYRYGDLVEVAEHPDIRLAAIHPDAPIPDGWHVWDPGYVDTEPARRLVTTDPDEIPADAEIVRRGWELRRVGGQGRANEAVRLWHRDDDHSRARLAAIMETMTARGTRRVLSRVGYTAVGHQWLLPADGAVGDAEYRWDDADGRLPRPDWAGPARRIIEARIPERIVRIDRTIIRTTTGAPVPAGAHTLDSLPEMAHPGLVNRLTPSPLEERAPDGITLHQAIKAWSRSQNSEHRIAFTRGPMADDGRWEGGVGVGGHLRILGRYDRRDAAEAAAMDHLRRSRSELVWQHALPDIVIVHARTGESSYDALNRTVEERSQ